MTVYPLTTPSFFPASFRAFLLVICFLIVGGFADAEEAAEGKIGFASAMPEVPAISGPSSPVSPTTYTVKQMQVAIEVFVVEVNQNSNREIGGNVAYDYYMDPLADLAVDRATMSFLPSVEGGLDLILQHTGKQGRLDMELRALIEKDQAVVRTKPIVVTMHNTPVTIKTVDSIPYQDMVFDKKGVKALALTYKDVGINITITPTVLDLEEGKVQMNITNMEVSSVASFRIERQVSRPVISMSKATSNVIVRSGEMLVIGGLNSKRESIIEERVPYLGRIPLLGWFFKGQRKVIRDISLKFYITPHILPPGVNPIMPMDFKHQEILSEPMASPTKG